jgi:hypothetical protein
MAKEIVMCADCGKQMPKISRTKDGMMYIEYQPVHYIDGNTHVILCKECYRKRFPPSYSGHPCE